MGAGVCGVDLAGDETFYPTKDFVPLFAEARRLELPITIHAGEAGGADSIRDAIQMGAKRIGHGIAMRGDVALQQFCVSQNIGIEMCPTSNLQTGAVKNIADYPMREFLDHGVCVTVNTDNRTVSNTALTKELQLLQDSASTAESEIIRLQQNAVTCSFADDSIKDSLLKELR